MATGDRHGFFWQSQNGDRTYGADSFEKWLKKFFSTGVYANDCAVTATGSGMSVTVATGYSNLNGKVLVMDTAADLTIEPANSRYPRIDAVVIRRDNLNRTITPEVKTGSYNGNNPTAPTPTRTADIYEIVLAHVHVAPGAASISQANITDKREDTTVCGYITSPFESIDLTQIMAQMETEFDEWFDYMKGQLSEDAAGRLQQEVDALTARIDGMTTGGSVFEIYTQETDLYYQPVLITSPRGTVYHGQFDDTGKAIISGVTDVGSMTIQTTDGTQTATRTQSVTYYSNYTVYINFFQATIDVSTTSSDLIGQTVTASLNGSTSSGVIGSNGHATIIVRNAGTYTLSVTSDGQTYTTTATVTTDQSTVTATLNSWNATVNITAQESFYGQSVLIYKGGTYVKTVVLDNAGTATAVLHETGTYTFKSYSSGTEEVDIEINIASQTTYSINFTYEPTYNFGFREVLAADGSTVTYPAGVDNEGYTAATTSSKGSWESFLTDVLQNKPAMVKSDGTLDYWLNPADYTKKADGTASDYNNASYNGAGAFAWVRNLYIKTVWSNATTRTVYYSNQQIDTDYKRMFGDKEGIWIPMGLISATNSPKSLIASSPIRSLPGSITLASNTKFFGGAIKNHLRDIMTMMFKNAKASHDYAPIEFNKMTSQSRLTDTNTEMLTYTNTVLTNTSGGLAGFKTRTNTDGTNDSKIFHSQVLPKFIYDVAIDADSFKDGTIRTSEDYGSSFSNKGTYTSPVTSRNYYDLYNWGLSTRFVPYGSASMQDAGDFGLTGATYTSSEASAGLISINRLEAADYTTGSGWRAQTYSYGSSGNRYAFTSINAAGTFHNNGWVSITNQDGSTEYYCIMTPYSAITVIPPASYNPAA